MRRVVWEKFPFRILEVADEISTPTDLMGDCYDYEKSGYTGTREELAQEKEDFLNEFYSEGCFGYELEIWAPKVGEKWKHLDSLYGFVGRYNPKKGHKYNHYIIKEMQEQVNVHFKKAN